jgi:adenosylcobinamide kinase / adenosylcobinamide-phosphate guanylyltransferase
VSLAVLIGGARSGKSSLALERAVSAEDVVFVATGEARDEEMAARIERHRRERPGHWDTVEEPLALREALESADRAACLVIDCLTLWVANLVEAGRTDEEIEAEAREAARAAAERSGATLVVTNEVGLGVVPDTPLGRRYRDVLGRVNALFVSAADEALFVVAGRAIPLRSWA